MFSDTETKSYDSIESELNTILNLLKNLTNKAEKKGFTVHIKEFLYDEPPNSLLKVEGETIIGITNTITMRVYKGYTTEDLLVTLSHEVGHIFTTDVSEYNERTLYYEYLASDWAVKFLRDKLPQDLLKEVVKKLDYAYQTYIRNIPVISRAIQRGDTNIIQSFAKLQKLVLE